LSAPPETEAFRVPVLPPRRVPEEQVYRAEERSPGAVRGPFSFAAVPTRPHNLISAGLGFHGWRAFWGWWNPALGAVLRRICTFYRVSIRYFARSLAACLSSQDFSKEMRFCSVLMRLRPRRAQIPVCLCPAANGRDAVSVASYCTEFGQGPVDELHIIENMADRVLS
jgi:hypothetical protein